jgi:hypothetical protein
MPVSSNMSAMLLLCAVLIAGAQAARIPAGQRLGGPLGGPEFETSLAFLKQYMPEADKILEAPFLYSYAIPQCAVLPCFPPLHPPHTAPSTHLHTLRRQIGGSRFA